MWASEIIFLSNSAASISICIIFAFGAKLSLLAATRFENLAPAAMSKSQFNAAIFAAGFPCMPTSPKNSSAEHG